MAFSDNFNEHCFEHMACKIIFLFLEKWEVIVINF